MSKPFLYYWDYNCPLCFLNQMLFEHLENRGGIPIEIEWRGFQQYPELPPEGLPVYCFDTDSLKGLMAEVKEIVRREGFQPFSLPMWVPNSRLALEGAELAKERGLFSAYNKAVFRAFFIEGKDIGGIMTLLEIAQEIGMNEEELEEVLLSGSMRPRLVSYRQEAQLQGVQGVPILITPDKGLVRGVVPREILKGL